MTDTPRNSRGFRINHGGSSDCTCGHPRDQHDDVEGCRVYEGAGPETCPCTKYQAATDTESSAP